MVTTQDEKVKEDAPERCRFKWKSSQREEGGGCGRRKGLLIQ